MNRARAQSVGTEHRRRRRGAHGLTLLEMLTTLVVISMLVGSLASAMRLATLSIDSATSPTMTAIDQGEALDRLNAEVRLATRFTERTATAMTFTVPDQTGDGVADTIRYAWAGAGSPLTRSVNGLPSPAAALLDNVQALNFDYLTRSVQPLPIESSQQLFSSYTATYNATGPIKATAWEGESFRPTFPANAISWKITAADIMARRTTNSGTISVRIYAIDAANKPTGAPLSSSTVNVSSLPTTFGWVRVPLPPVSLAVTAGAALVIASTNNSSQSEVTGVIPVSPPTVGMYYVPSTTGGVTWDAPVTNIALNFNIYGTVTTQGP